ncbi:hypothetical protein ACFL20_09300 [Spirochaetota bacterium]
MENIIETITSNNIYLIIAILFFLMIVILIVKKFFKLFVISILVFTLYLGYLAFTGQSIPKSKEDVIEHITGKVVELKEFGIKEIIENKNQIKKN